MDTCSTYERESGSIQRDQDLYFPDGNVVLMVQNSEGISTYFRLHQSLLAKRSPVFHDMFSFPSPPTPDTKLYDGVPQVELYDDPDDLKVFLIILYEPFSSPLRSWHLMTPFEAAHEMLGPFKLANKYQVDDLRNAMVQLLCSNWPRHVAEWDNIKSLWRKEPGIKLDPSSIIRIARDGNIPELLPLSFYLLSKLFSNTAQDWESTPRGAKRVENSPRLFLLSREDIVTLAFGQKEMTKWISSHSARFREWTCPDRFEICETRVRLLMLDLLALILRINDILLALSPRGLEDSSVCSSCRSSYLAGLRVMRHEFFTDLPNIFGLVEPEITQ